jgi:DNA-binding beta-propeller fold protein YncE
MDHLHVASQRSRLAIAVSTVVALIAALILVVSPARSLAAGTGDQIYWGNESGAVRSGNLNGGVAADVRAGSPCGVAIDPAAGKIYWANFFGGGIMVANLDGSGDALSLFPSEAGDALCGVAVDPAHGTIYWANFTTNTIKVGNLGGSGTPLTLFTEPSGSAPSGVAIDPVAGKIYWTNQFTDQVRVGNLSGGTTSTLFGSDATVPTVEDNPIGVAIDPAAGKIYWTNLGQCCSGPGQVRVGNLDGSGSPSTLFANEAGPGGLAIDPGANKIYWANFGPGVIRSGPLDGSDTASTLFSGESFSLFAALLKTPLNTRRPEISGGAKVGKDLMCQNAWAPDLLGAFLYRAPATIDYQWKRNGVSVGTNSATFSPPVAGDYTCTVTAANQAGSTSLTSAVKKVKVK